MHRFIPLMLMALTTLTACGRDDDTTVTAAAPEPVRHDPAPTAPATWEVLHPGGDTACYDGAPFLFFARQGDPERLVVYFQGGGACWNAETCDPLGEPTFKRGVSEDELDRYSGIFAFDRAENPLREHSFVVAPYCTGDVHLGNRVTHYAVPERDGRPAGELEVRHVGLVNARAVLDWASANFPAAREIFVTGSSAGAIPSPYFAWQLAERHPDARILQLGDGASGYRQQDGGADELLARWGTLDALAEHDDFAGLAPEAFNFELLYTVAARHAPAVHFAQFDNAEDDVQKAYLRRMGNAPAALEPLIRANQDDIRRDAPQFSVYLAGGEGHTILARPGLFDLHVDGLRFRDWLAELVNGAAVADVHCDDCRLAAGIDDVSP